MRPRNIALAFICLTVIAGAVRCQCDDAGGQEDLTPVMNLGSSAPEFSAVDGKYAIAFGDVVVATTKTVNLTIKNTGTFRLEIQAVALAAGTSAEFAYSLQGAGVPVKLEPQKETTLQVAYTPAAAGPDAGALELTTNAEGTQKTVSIALTGNGVTPDIEVCTPETSQCNDDGKVQLALDFGQVALGQGTTAKQVTVANAGQYPLAVKDAVVLACPWDKPDCAFVDMVAPSEPEFVLDPVSISGSFAPAQVATISITYKPLSGGANRSALRITSDDADELEVWVVLTAVGIAPRLCPQPPLFLEFGSVTIGSSADKEFTFTSCGTQPLEITAIAFAASNTPEFVWVDGAGPATPRTLAPGESVTLKIRYAPTDEGEDLGRVEVESSDPNAPKGYVDLHGNGTVGPTCALTVSPVTVNFGKVKAGTSLKKTVSLTNIGDADCAVTDIARVSGTDKNEFTLSPVPTYPVTVKSGGNVDVQFEYKPVDNTPDSAKWRVTSSDAKHPRQDVDLTANPAGPTGCSLEAVPASLNFGLVALGSGKALTYTVTNVGDANCFIQSNKLDPLSSRSFQINKVTGLNITQFLLPNSKYTVEILYSPRSPQTESGKAIVEIQVNFQVKVAASVTLSGGGTGPKLCVTPASVDFGIINVGSSADQPVEVQNCGTADLTVNTVKPGAGTSADFTLGSPVPTGLFKAGEKKTLTVKYKPSDIGEDKGTVELDSTDPISKVTIVKLIGYGADPNTQCGNVTGRVCSPGGEIWLGGAEVSAGGRTTKTDANGYFTLTCVPVGQQTVHIASGSFSTDVTVLVENRKTANLSSQCVKGTAKIAVFWGEWDHAESILDRLKLPYDSYGSSGAEQDSIALLADYAKLSQYDILIMNCGMEEDSAGDPNVVSNLQTFVKNGGSIFASDWALEYCHWPWPGYATYGNEGSSPGPIVPADILDPNLVAIMQSSTIKIGDWYTQIESAGASTTVHVQGDTNKDGSRRPMIISFEPYGPSGGRCLYTNFHDASQNAQDIDKMFYYLVFQL